MKLQKGYVQSLTAYTNYILRKHIGTRKLISS